MAEFAVTDGMPPPPDLPRGECIVTSLHDDEGKRTGIRIDQADPRILVSAPLLAQVVAGCSPWAEFDWAPPLREQNGLSFEHRWEFWEGGLLKIRGVNRTVVYRVLEYVPRVRAYIAEWPH